MTPSAPNFFFRFYRFVGPTEKRTTELVRNQTEADGMRALIDQGEATVQNCITRVVQWAKGNGVTVCRYTRPSWTVFVRLLEILRRSKLWVSVGQSNVRSSLWNTQS
jgi:hypothetical protein